MPISVSYGGGVNSTGMLCWMVEKKIVPTVILFADTGGEKPETYQYIENFDVWLQQRGFPNITTVKYYGAETHYETLEEETLRRNTLPAIAFGWKTCSQKYKIRPQVKYLEEKYPDSIYYHYIGFRRGEEGRMMINPRQYHFNYYPLIEAGIDQEGCYRLIKEAGLPIPPKSSCFFCPNMKRHEILALGPELKERVKKIEANATQVAELKGLGRHYRWTDLINADESQYKLFDDLDMYQTPCGCIT